MKLRSHVYQDGAEFYHEEEGVIASYPHLVSNAYDMDGAMTALRQFSLDFPQHVNDTPDWPT